MAALALGAVGAAVGSTFGMTSLGWTVGSTLGGMLFPTTTELPPVFGPRLSDLKVQTSTYGNMIPRLYGATRIAGNCIWATDILERATTTQSRSGGKGGGGGSTQTQTTYSYYINCAISVCEGEIAGIRKVWANGKLILNVADDATAETVLASDSRLTVYFGNETQVDDPLIESYEGVGNVPAYRGTAYVVFTDFALGDFGNRMPNFEFEVVKTGTGSLTVSQLASMSGYVQSGFGATSTSGGVLWANNGPNGYDNIGAYDIATGSLLVNFVFPPTNGAPFACYATEGGDCYAFRGPVYKFSLDGTKLRFEPAPGTSAVPDMNYAHYYRMDPSGAIWFGYGLGSGGSLGRVVFDEATLTYVYTSFVSGTAESIPVNGADIPDRVYAGTLSNAIAGRWGYLQVSTGTWVDLHVSGAQFYYPGVIHEGYIYMGGSGADSRRNYIEKYDPDGVLVASVAISGIQSGGISTAFGNMVPDHQGFLWTTASVDSSGNTSTKLIQIDLATMTVVHESAWYTNVSDPPLGAMLTRDFNGNSPVLVRSGAVTSVINVPGAKLTKAQVDLGSIVSDLCQQSELTGADVDVAGIAGVLVDGYVVSQRGSIRGMIEPLMQAFFFDAVESDDKIKFVKRGSASAVSIPEADLGVMEEASTPDSDLWQKTRKQELELPIEINISYLSAATNYQISSQASRRLTSRSKVSITYQLSITMSDDKARQIADALMYMAWTGRNTVEFTTSRVYTKYEPTDVVSLPIGNVVQSVRITHKDENVGSIIRWSAEYEDGVVYTQTSTGVPSLVPDNTIPLVGSTYCMMLDIPMLRTADDDPGFYVAMYGLTDGWAGGQLFQSPDGVTYSAVTNGTVLESATVGYANGVLAAYGTADNNEDFDIVNSVSVTLNTGTLESATRNEVLAGANVALLGSEVIQFMTATLTAANTYTLSGLLRGRLGTEWAASLHASGDKFVLLNETLRTVTASYNDVNVEFFYKAVTLGKTLAETAPFKFTNTAVRKKPLSPWLLGGGRSGAGGDLHIQWRRRTRWPDISWTIATDPPLDETEERYAVHILNSTGLVVRSIESTVTEATYTAADQIIDFGSTQSAVDVKAYQLSPELGRGYAASRTL